MKSSKTKSLTKNSIYYLIYDVLNVLFPLITGIYVARVLLPVNVGEVAYAQNIVQYFVILSFLGLPTYGMREISKVRNQKDKLSRLYSELFIINFISTVVFLSIYTAMIFSVPQFRENLPLFLIVGTLIALNMLNNTWLYTGLEEFQFISIRNIIFKIFNMVLLVLFVRKPEDYLFYAAITVLGTAGNYIMNIGYAPRFVKFTFSGLEFKRHMKPIFYLVAVNLAIEIYTLVDMTMLGFFYPKTNVAFYTYGNKIYKVLLQVINSFTMVVVPRLSFYYKEHKTDAFNRLISHTLKVIIILAIPLIVGLIFTADDMIALLYGPDYASSAAVLKAFSVLLLISPIGYLLGSRVLLVTNQENKMLISVGIGAVINVIGNYCLIPPYAEFGAVIASVCSEIVVMAVYVFLGRRCYHITGILKSTLKVVASACLMALLLKGLSLLQMATLLRLVVQVVCAVALYFAILLLLKEEIVYGYFIKLRDRRRRKPKAN